MQLHVLFTFQILIDLWLYDGLAFIASIFTIPITGFKAGKELQALKQRDQMKNNQSALTAMMATTAIKNLRAKALLPCR